MRKKTFRSIDDVLRSPLASALSQRESAPVVTDRVLRSTKLEDSIYRELRMDDDMLDQVEREAVQKLRSFPALARDVFQSFYSLMLRRQDADMLSTAARKFHVPILEHAARSEDFPALKSVCEGRELPSYEAAAEFTARLGGELDDLLSGLGGDNGAAQTLEKLEEKETQATEELASLMELQKGSKGCGEPLEQEIVNAANALESKQRQAEAVGKLIDTAAAQNREKIAGMVSASVKAAAEKAEETAAILAAWSDEPGNMEKTEMNTALLNRVRGSKTLRDIAKYLGRFREIFAQGKRNSYAYGRGETYALELGNNLSRALTSELALLAAPETIPLFIRKYERKQIKQYRRREPIYKGMGDIICCLDESDSTDGEAADWGKAVALTLLEIAAESGRRFALIHFSGRGSFHTDLFLPGQYGTADKMRAAETFLGGGTNFATPMEEALRLMAEQHFEKADIVFVTDGACAMPQDMLDKLRKEQLERRFTITGILLDQGTAGMEFSLQPFCQKIYRTSELAGDEIVQRLVADRV